MSKFYKIIITFFYSLLIFILICALTLDVFAQTIELPFVAVTGIVSPWTAEVGLTLDETSTANYIINPFIERSYIEGDYSIASLTPITEQFDYYGQAICTDTASSTSPSSILLGTNSFSSSGVINTISLQLCIPYVSDDSDIIDQYSFSIMNSGQVLTPDVINITKSDAYNWESVYTAPVRSWTFYTYNIMLYYNQPISTTENTYISMGIPISAYDFTTGSFRVGVVFGYNALEIDYYETLEEAQNAKIIDLLTKFPNKVKYDDAIQDNESLADSFSQAGDFEQSLYDNMSIPDSFDPDTTSKINTLFTELDFMWYDWVITLVISGIGLALLSYALFGGP